MCSTILHKYNEFRIQDYWPTLNLQEMEAKDESEKEHTSDISNVKISSFFLDKDFFFQKGKGNILRNSLDWVNAYKSLEILKKTWIILHHTWLITGDKSYLYNSPQLGGNSST